MVPPQKKDQNYAEEETEFLLSKEFYNSNHQSGPSWEGLEMGAHVLEKIFPWGSPGQKHKQQVLKAI